MGDVKAFLAEVEDADANQAAAVVKKASPALAFALYRCLQRVETQEANQFTAWLGNCLSNDPQRSTTAAALYEFSLHFIPQLIWLHLDLLGSSKNREVATNVECCLVCVYNRIAGDVSCRKDVRLAKLENASIYHEASSRLHVTLTTSALQTQAGLTTLGRDASCPERIDRIIASNRSAVLRFILSQYCESLGNRSAVSMIAFCHMCTRVCVSGFNLKASNGRGVSSTDDVFTPKVGNASASEKPAATIEGIKSSLSVQDVLIGLRLGSREDSKKSFILDENSLVLLSERTRHGLAPEVFQELATGVHVCMFNGQEQCGMQALNALHWRATESLIPQLLMMTRALLHALSGPCGSPEDGFYGLSAQTFSTLPKILQHSILNRTTVDGTSPRDAPHISVQAPSPSGTPRHSHGDLTASFPKVDQPESFQMELDASASSGGAHRAGAGKRDPSQSASSMETLVETLV